eukprot:PLAT4447.1.p2 GENE.PLAT4447.1~~PLAT4447.1.p2  ORF type:complete len:393 (-),score=82.52 PLAT4447.1:60-1238(-)
MADGGAAGGGGASWPADVDVNDVAAVAAALKADVEQRLRPILPAGLSLESHAPLARPYCDVLTLSSGLGPYCERKKLQAPHKRLMMEPVTVPKLKHTGVRSTLFSKQRRRLASGTVLQSVMSSEVDASWEDLLEGPPASPAGGDRAADGSDGVPLGDSMASMARSSAPASRSDVPRSPAARGGRKARVARRNKQREMAWDETFPLDRMELRVPTMLRDEARRKAALKAKRNRAKKKALALASPAADRAAEGDSADERSAARAGEGSEAAHGAGGAVGEAREDMTEEERRGSDVGVVEEGVRLKRTTSARSPSARHSKSRRRLRTSGGRGRARGSRRRLHASRSTGSLERRSSRDKRAAAVLAGFRDIRGRFSSVQSSLTSRAITMAGERERG